MADRIDAAGLLDRPRGYARRTLDQLPDGDRLVHGDYQPGNVLFTAGRTTVIDWTTAARGQAEANHANTALLLQWADPLPDTSVFATD